MGGAPVHGNRNNFIYREACLLRYICNSEAAWINAGGHSSATAASRTTEILPSDLSINPFLPEIPRWKDVDFLFVDMPPGTGDVPLTVFQSLPVDGIVVVASPQELVSMIVAKAVNMAEMMKVPMLGIVENMSYIVCPDCGKHINVFGDSHVDEVAAKHHLPVLAKCPIDPQLAALSDAGMIETYGGQFLEGAADACEKLLK